MKEDKQNPVEERMPFFDLTSMLAVECFFRHGLKDPWAPSIIRKFTDLFIYSEKARFAAPFYSDSQMTVEQSGTFPVLITLMARDPESVQGTVYRTDEQVELNTDFMDSSFISFSDWCLANRHQLKKWIEFHKQDWIRGTHKLRFKTHYLYPTDKLIRTKEFRELVDRIHISADDICYAFDLVLRYSLLGQIAGEHQHYLAHPIREEQNFPTMERDLGHTPIVPVEFGKCISTLLDKLTLDEYTAFLNEARSLVRQFGLVSIRPNAVEKETLRELASKLWLPPKLRSWEKTYGIITGIICGAGAYPSFGPFSAILGGAVSIASIFWSGTLPRSISRIKWLRWAYEWEIEQYARKTE